MIKPTYIPGKDKTKPGIDKEDEAQILQLNAYRLSERKKLQEQMKKLEQELGIPALAKKFDLSPRQVRRIVEKYRWRIVNCY